MLLNPLGEMGCGAAPGAQKLRRPDDHVRNIARLTLPFAADLDVVHIRFPNDDKPLSGCGAGTIIYFFTKGEVTVCPYLVFAARTRVSQHPDTDFIVGNVWEHDDIAARLDAYRFPRALEGRRQPHLRRLLPQRLVRQGLPGGRRRRWRADRCGGHRAVPRSAASVPHAACGRCVMSGMFVTIDGPGGVGKSTVAAAVVELLRAEGVPVHATREPSDSEIGRIARDGTDRYRGMSMACLIAADRYQHVEHEVRPALARGALVVCDRYVASSLVLQSLGRRLARSGVGVEPPRRPA
ncbi:dTMP kinase [Streptomyces sp. CC224B]|uniref:dTMP kinase n=1 Tax=Streptomyces sp. CC224B TaxID=3044571 RepID=UPI0024A92EFE|nr:dTMP kinase [Streptomyces sp. CC224B]